MKPFEIYKAENKKAALAYIEENPLNCAVWMEGGKEMSVIYWNGKKRVQESKKKINWNKNEENRY